MASGKLFVFIPTEFVVGAVVEVGLPSLLILKNPTEIAVIKTAASKRNCLFFVMITPFFWKIVIEKIVNCIMHNIIFRILCQGNFFKNGKLGYCL